MKKISRRNFVGRLLCAIPGLAFLSKVSSGKERLTKSPIEKILETPKGARVDMPSFGPEVAKIYNDEQDLTGITWNYASDDVDPITYIDGKPVKQYMWEAIDGIHITPDFIVYKITSREIEPEKLASNFVPIHPVCIFRCNVKERWIDYAQILRWHVISGVVKQSQKPYSFSLPSYERDEKGRLVLRRLNNIRGLTVDLLDPKGEVITTLRGE